jgi:hypothetical protein
LIFKVVCSAVAIGFVVHPFPEYKIALPGIVPLETLGKLPHSAVPGVYDCGFDFGGHQQRRSLTIVTSPCFIRRLHLAFVSESDVYQSSL